MYALLNPLQAGLHIVRDLFLSTLRCNVHTLEQIIYELNKVLVFIMGSVILTALLIQSTPSYPV